MPVRLPAKKYKKKNPTVARLSFEGSGGETKFIDTALALSIINQKAFYQQAYYYINSIELYNNENAYIDIHTLPDTWYLRSAYTRGRRIFNEMNDRIIKQMSGDITPKYHDFKVYMDDRHRTTGNMLPSLYSVNAAQTAFTADEWAYSQYVSADSDGDIVVDPGAPSGFKVNQEADDFYIHMMGAHVGSSDNWTSVGLLRSYVDTKVRVQASEPNLPSFAQMSGDPLANIVDYSSEEQVNDLVQRLQDDNDQPPYDHNDSPGTGVYHLQHVARLATSVETGRVTKASGFCAPLGLICVDPQSIATGWRVVLNLAQGTYNGVYAERV